MLYSMFNAFLMIGSNSSASVEVVMMVCLFKVLL